MAKIQLKLVRSEIGRPETQRLTLRALGLRRMNQVVEHTDSPALQGQIDKVRHLLEVTAISGS
jgi:large subunit ribosomal protein L30